MLPELLCNQAIQLAIDDLKITVVKVTKATPFIYDPMTPLVTILMLYFQHLNHHHWNLGFDALLGFLLLKGWEQVRVGRVPNTGNWL